MSRISRAPLALLTLLFGQACGDVPSLGSTHCDYTLDVCSDTFVGGLEPEALAIFDVRATRKVAPSARTALDTCSLLMCDASARTLPGADGDVWLAFSYPVSSEPDPTRPWLVRVGPDGAERERVLRGPELLGSNDAIVFDDGAGGVALLSAGDPPTLHVKRPDAELHRQPLVALTRTGATYTAPALFPDGSLRLRELRDGEAPSSMVVVAVEPNGALRWRQRYAPSRTEPQDTLFPPDPLPSDPDDTPRRGFVFEGDRYALIGAVDVSWSPRQAVISFDAQGELIGALGGVQADGETLTLATSPTRFAYSADVVADTGSGLAVRAADVSALSLDGNVVGQLAGGRRVHYYDSAARALALDEDGALYSVSTTGPYLEAAPVICKIAAGGDDAECSELVLCQGELDTLVWPDVTPVEYEPVLDGTAVALAPDQLALHISYVCADADTAAAMRELTWFDFLVAAAIAEGNVPPEGFTDVPYVNESSVLAEGRYEPHDELVFVDLTTALP